MKIEIEISDAISDEAIEVYAKIIKQQIARINPGKTIQITETDAELVAKGLSDYVTQIYKRFKQIQVTKEIDAKINGNNL